MWWMMVTALADPVEEPPAPVEPAPEDAPPAEPAPEEAAPEPEPAPAEPSPAEPAPPPPVAVVAPIGPLTEPSPLDPRLAKRSRVTNPGLGFGFTGLASTGGPDLDGGFRIELRSESAVSPNLQFNLALGLGVTQPERTADMIDFGIAIGEWTNGAFVSVTDWAGEPVSPALAGFKFMGVFFAYFGLGMCYLAIPVVWVLSPFAAIGHTVVGPTISWHTDVLPPNLFLEAGVGGALYGHPDTGEPSSGVGPILGVGSQLGRQSVAFRVWLSPPGLHSGELNDLVLEGALTVGL